MFSSKIRYSSLILLLAVVVLFYSTALPFSAELVPADDISFYDKIHLSAEDLHALLAETNYLYCVFSGLNGQQIDRLGNSTPLSDATVIIENLEFYFNDDILYIYNSDFIYYITSYEEFFIYFDMGFAFPYILYDTTIYTSFPVLDIQPLGPNFLFGYTLEFNDSFLIPGYEGTYSMFSGQFSPYFIIKDFTPDGFVSSEPFLELLPLSSFSSVPISDVFSGLGYDISFNIRTFNASYRFAPKSDGLIYSDIKSFSFLSASQNDSVTSAAASYFVPYFGIYGFDVYVPKEAFDLTNEYLYVITNPSPESAAEVERLEQELEEISEQLRQDASDLEVEKPNISDSVENLPSEVIEGMGEASETVLSPLMTIDLIATLFSVLFGVVALKLILFGSGTA